VLATEAPTREAGYVAMSRARAGTELFVVSGAYEDGLEGDPAADEPLVATAARLARSRAKWPATTSARVLVSAPIPRPMPVEWRRGNGCVSAHTLWCPRVRTLGSTLDPRYRHVLARWETPGVKLAITSEAEAASDRLSIRSRGGVLPTFAVGDQRALCPLERARLQAPLSSAESPARRQLPDARLG
jgi:hypothetical protein